MFFCVVDENNLVFYGIEDNMEDKILSPHISTSAFINFDIFHRTKFVGDDKTS